jgi:hypothetical protein
MSTSWHADELSKVGTSPALIGRERGLMKRTDIVEFPFSKKNNRISSSGIRLPNMFTLQRISPLPSGPFRLLASKSFLHVESERKIDW